MLSGSETQCSGTMFHAKYDKAISIWKLEVLHVKLESLKTLMLLWRVATLDRDEMEGIFGRIEVVLQEISLELECGRKYEGKHESGNYDCIIWTADALKVLREEYLIPQNHKSVGQWLDSFCYTKLC